MSSQVLAASDITASVFSEAAVSDVAVSVRGLSKSYSIAKNAVQHSTIGEALVHKLRNPLAKAERETFWALNDVNFDIQKGDVVGIIGRNGAGKSTLLKILSRITEPTRGKIDLYGRVGSLLEVGTGFHPELTGRENVYLNGAILGMKKSEIARQFDAIIDFSGTAQFLDTPVKRYSSGMYVRLAFAVAAHLNPEILIVDEVLAVGDAEFQKKCLGKMQDVADSGRTVLFVSHNMGVVAELCRTAILMAKGRVETIGDADKVVRSYLAGQRNKTLGVSGSRRTKHFSIEQASCYGASPGAAVFPHGPLTVQADVVPQLDSRDLCIHFNIMDEDGRMLLGFDGNDFDAYAKNRPGTTVQFMLNLPHCPLPPGTYSVDAYIKSNSNHVYELADQLVTFEVSESPVYGSRLYDRKWHGALLSEATMSAEELH